MLVGSMLSAARRKLVTVPADTPTIEVAQRLAHKEANLVVVCNADGALAGVVAKTDIVRQMAHCHGTSCRLPVSAVMTPNVAFARPRDLVADVWSLMKARGLKHVPVVDDDGRPVGLLIARDVLQVLVKEVEYEEQLLRDYVMSIGYH